MIILNDDQLYLDPRSILLYKRNNIIIMTIYTTHQSLYAVGYQQVIQVSLLNYGICNQSIDSCQID